MIAADVKALAVLAWQAPRTELVSCSAVAAASAAVAIAPGRSPRTLSGGGLRQGRRDSNSEGSQRRRDWRSDGGAVAAR